MPITITSLNQSYSGESLKARASQLGAGNSPVVNQILTRFDFQNRRFKDAQALVNGITLFLIPIQSRCRFQTPIEKKRSHSF